MGAVSGATKRRTVFTMCTRRWVGGFVMQGALHISTCRTLDAFVLSLGLHSGHKMQADPEPVSVSLLLLQFLQPLEGHTYEESATRSGCGHLGGHPGRYLFCRFCTTEWLPRPTRRWPAWSSRPECAAASSPTQCEPIASAHAARVPRWAPRRSVRYAWSTRCRPTAQLVSGRARSALISQLRLCCERLARSPPVSATAWLPLDPERV